MPDISRKGNYAQKKTHSVSAARVKHTDVSSTVKQELFVLPENAIIVAAYINVETAGQALLTVDFGFDGGNELGNDLALSSAGVVGGTITTELATGTGKTVTAQFSADPTAGQYVFIVDYIEYDLCNGQMTDYVA